MKKIIYVLIFLFSIFIVREVKADTFREGEFISGEYINKVKDGKTYYMTMQYIYRDDGKFVYCLEPFATFETGHGYNGANFNYESISGLSTEQIRRIELLSYYGYNYLNRKENKWYVITQYLIWKTVDSNANIYFTDKVNGKKIDKYQKEIQEIEADLIRNDVVPSFMGKNISVNYNGNLELEDTNQVLKEYKVVGNVLYKYEIDNNKLSLKNIDRKGRIAFKRNHTLYDNSSFIYVNDNSQNLFLPGNPREKEYYLKLEVLKGDIELKIYDDNSIYSIEKDFNNTCYGIFNSNEEMIDKVCTDKEMTYKTNDLKYDTYYIKQISVGKGYEKDDYVYEVHINNQNEHGIVELKNKLIKNKIKIKKEYCKKDNCLLEEGALFNIFDKNDSLVDTIKTDKNGYGFIELGYGSYYGIQIGGMEGYTLIESFTDNIHNSTDNLSHHFYNKYIEKEEDRDEVLEMPPETGVELDYSIVDNLVDIIRNMIDSIIFYFKKI